MKERLTGAIILVALIVLLVPELLTGPPQVKPVGVPPGRAGAAAASGAHAALRSYTLPLGAGAAAITPVAPTQSDPAAKAPVAPVRSATPKVSPDGASRSGATMITPSPAPPRPAATARPAVKSTPKPAQSVARPVPERARVVKHPSAGSLWAVQLGVFAVHADALRLGRRVRARGIPVRITPMHVRGRTLWRVRTAAVTGRAAGHALARRLRAFGLKGELLRP